MPEALTNLKELVTNIAKRTELDLEKIRRATAAAEAASKEGKQVQAEKVLQFLQR